MILLSELRKQGETIKLIPAHINIARCDNYFWHFDSDIKDWVRGEEMPKSLKRMYKAPIAKSNYK